jgi:hypothetical protein
MAGRKPLWEPELGGFNMQESPIMRKWRQEARDKGVEEGMEKGMEKGALTTARAAVVNVLQARFPQTPVPAGVHAALEKNTDLGTLTDWHREAVLTGSPADFERFLAARAS